LKSDERCYCVLGCDEFVDTAEKGANCGDTVEIEGNAIYPLQTDSNSED